MTTLPAHGPLAAACSAPRPAGDARGPAGAVVRTVLGTGVLAAAAMAVPVGGATVHGLAVVVLSVLLVGFVLRQAPHTAAAAGWRWLAASMVVSSVGAAIATGVTGVPGAAVLGLIPGQALLVVALRELADRSFWRRSPVQLLTTATLCILATTLTMHVVLDLVPTPPGTAVLLRAAVYAVPLTVAVTTAAAVLFTAACEPARRPVAALLLASQGFLAVSAALSVLAWGTGSAAAQLAVWPVVVGVLVTLTLGCLRDRPQPRDTDPRLRPLSAAMALFPHLLALTAGTAWIIRWAVTHQLDAGGAVLAVLGMVVLVGDQAVMWHTQRRLAGELVRSESFFRTLVRSSVDPVVILDDRLRMTFASPSVIDLIGVGPERIVGHEFGERIHRDDAPMLLDALAAPGGIGDSAVRTFRVQHADGRWRLIQATVRDLRSDPDVGALVLFNRDVTPSDRATEPETELLELSLTDPVTGLPNRAALVRRLGAVQRRQPSARPAALALLGIDGLAGLDAGTGAAVLRALTARLTRVLRGEDWLAIGKDGEFVVLVDGTIADAEVVASRLVAGVRPLTTADGKLPLSAAAGVTALPTDVDPGEALRRGTVALRSARLAGAGSVHRYDDALRREQDRRAQLRADLDGAVERGELRLVFQPVVDLVLHRTVSVEALLRWRHPVFGEVSPVEFVPLAEESPLIGDLGRWVLRESCTAVAALAASGPDNELGVAVNVSARQVRSGELVPDVVAALESSGLPPSRLIVEITESVLMDDSHVIEDLAVLRKLGVRIAVDDFGTGWSSLAYLVGLPIDILKMDQHFLAGMEQDAQRRALCRAVLQLGASLGLPVVVEGVTTRTELGLLRDMGHRYLQGFVFSRPLEASQLRDGTWRRVVGAS